MNTNFVMRKYCMQVEKKLFIAQNIPTNTVFNFYPVKTLARFKIIYNLQHILNSELA